MGRDVIAGAERGELLIALEDAFGPEIAAKVSAAIGGYEVYIPATPYPGKGLCKRIDFEVVAWLTKTIGPGIIIFPMGLSDQRRKHYVDAKRLIAEGLSNSAVARELGVHTRTVSRYRRQIGRERRA